MKSSSSLNLLLIVILLAPGIEITAQTRQPAPERPPEQRIGVETSRRLLLTLPEAMLMALENNRDIEIERLNVQMNEFDLRAAGGAYDPTFSASLFYDRRTAPVASLLAGGDGGRLRTTDLAGTSGLTQRLP